MPSSPRRSSPAEAKPGDTVTFKVTAKLEPGCHIYKYSKSKKRERARSTPRSTSSTPLVSRSKETGRLQEPEKHKDPNFAEVEFVEYHEDEVTWSIKLKIPDGTAPGKKILRCQARYRSATQKSCSIPGQWTLPDAELTVVSGDGKVPDATVAAKPAHRESRDAP